MRAGDSVAIATTILWVSQSIHTHTHTHIYAIYVRAGSGFASSTTYHAST